MISPFSSMHSLVAFQLQLRFFPQGVAAGTALAPTSARAQQGFTNDPIVWIQTNFRKKQKKHQISCGFFAPSFSPTRPGVGIALRLLGEAGVLQENFGQAIITAAFVDDILSLVPWIYTKLQGNTRHAKERCVFSDKHPMGGSCLMLKHVMVKSQVLFNILFSLGGEWHSKNAAVEVMSTSLKHMMSCSVG